MHVYVYVCLCMFVCVCIPQICPQFDPANRKGMTQTNIGTIQSTLLGGQCGKGRATHLK